MSDEADDETSWVQVMLTEHKSKILWGVLVVLSIAAFVALEYAFMLLFGPLAAVVYTIAFAAGLGLFATTTAVFGGVVTAFIGRIYFVLGQFAYDRPWLVQHNQTWRMHPGRQTDRGEEVHVEGQWHHIPDTEHQTVLHKRPFGILFWKDDDTLSEARVDDIARGASDVGLEGLSTDGGEESVSRGGVAQSADPHDVNLKPGQWLVDLKRYWTAGLEGVGDIDIIEKVEQVTMREQAADAGASKRLTIWGSVIGLILGAATGYIAMFGF